MVLSRLAEGLNVAGTGEIKDFSQASGQMMVTNTEMKPETVRLW